MSVHVGGRGPGHLARVQGGFSLARFLAQQEAGLLFRFAEAGGLFQTTDESAPVTTFGQVIGRVNDQRVGAGSPLNGTQSNNTFRPTWQLEGAKFDGVDDREETGFTAGLVSNHMVARATIPATLSGVQLIAGASSTGPTAAFLLGVNVAGQAVGGAGIQSFTTIVGSSDVRGQEVVLGLSHVIGGGVRLFVGAATEYDAAASGSPNTTLGINVGSRNSSGGSSNHFGGSVRTFAAWRGGPIMDQALFNQISSQL